ncbi:carbamoyltransferase C-terminal domain-containing protein [Micromonospora sp. NPDC049081]|uniref:carbamoyltransferase family protein n=1 Tax=Micromonospora sp. NPDC049081 TaxID=3155150 RepID=UPI00340078D2
MRYVLGISGLGQSQPYMRQSFPGLGERVYRLAQGADSAAALVTEDGIVAAAAEERFVRRKGTGEFPRAAIEYVLGAAGISPRDVSAVAHNFDFGRYQTYFESEGAIGEYQNVYAPEVIQRDLFAAFPRDLWSDDLKVIPILHHQAHAASALHCSGFGSADVLVADGIGEFESTSLYTGGSQGLRLRGQVGGLHSIGLVYGLVTMHLGFWMNFDEYKVMGLAPYGDRRRLRSAFDALVVRQHDGRYTTPLTYLNETPQERATYQRSREHLASVLGPPREPDASIEQHHLDIAAALQAVTEETIVGFLAAHQDEQSSENLCLAGGVALNCVVNQAIRKSGMYRRQFVQPAAGDDGTALGAALTVIEEGTEAPGRRIRPRIGPPYLGPAFTSERIQATLERTDLRWRRCEPDDLVGEAAALLNDGKVVALFQGRMEYGPRALGNRSILADPRTVEMRDRINSMVKQREEFRPLAPAVLHEYAEQCFEIDDPDEYLWMIETVDVRAAWRPRLGAVTHVDGTARIQVVRREDNELYWRLIDAFRAITDIPILLNTSFNSRGEPIVCSPEDAVATFSRIDIDAMVMGDVLVLR